jgi:hypothetical protein
VASDHWQLGSRQYWSPDGAENYRIFLALLGTIVPEKCSFLKPNRDKPYYN